MSATEFPLLQSLFINFVPLLTGIFYRHFPGGLVVKNLPAMQETQETWVWSPGQEDPQEKEMLLTPVFLAGELHEERSLAGYSPWGHKE